MGVSRRQHVDRGVGANATVDFGTRAAGRIPALYMSKKRRARRTVAPSRSKRAKRRDRVTVIDLASVEIRRLLPSQMPAASALRQEVVARATSGPSAILSGPPAQARLEEIHSALVDAATEHVQRRSPAEWLFYLRRFTRLFAYNARTTTAPYSRALAEVLTLRSTRAAPADTYEFDRDARVASDLLGLAALVEPIYVVHSAYRWVGKGAEIQFDPGRLPAYRAGSSVRDAVELYDSRQALGSRSIWQGSGLHRSLGSTIELEDVPATILLAVQDSKSGRYSLIPESLRDIPFLADAAIPDAVRWPDDLVDAVMLCWSILRDNRYLIGLLSPESSFPRAGYVLDHRERVLENLAHAVQEAGGSRLGGLLPESRVPVDPEAIYQRLVAALGSVWPLADGAPIRELEGGRSCFIDLVGATRRWTSLSRRSDVVGATANQYAAHFEDDIQAIIDDSKWRPSDGLRALRRRTLRTPSGQALTDLDAVGESGGTVLLVSAKSVPYSGAYDKGEHGEVRNRASDAVAAESAWAQKVDLLRSSPVGANYDLSAHRDFIAPVVLPFAPYLPIGSATRELSPGLRAVASVDELIKWLERHRR